MILTRQPQGAVRIDWSNPLARRLIFAVEGNGNLYAPVKGNFAGNVGDFGYSGASGFLAPELNGTSQYVSLPMADFTFPTSGDWTYATSGIRKDNYFHAFSAWNNSIGGRYLYFAVDGSTLYLDIPYLQAICSAPAPSIGVLHRYLATKNGTAITVYVDGEYVASGTLTVAQEIPTNGARVGANTGSGGFTNGTVGIIRGWSRGFSAEDARDEYRNPWQLFAPQRRTWVPGVLESAISFRAPAAPTSQIAYPVSDVLTGEWIPSTPASALSSMIDDVSVPAEPAVVGAPYLILKSKRTRQPVGAVLNRQHPLTNGLVAAFSCSSQHNLIDLVSGRAAINVGMLPSTCPYGYGLAPSSAGLVIPWAAAPGDYTLCAVMHRTTSSPNGWWYFADARAAGGSSNYLAGEGSTAYFGNGTFNTLGYHVLSVGRDAGYENKSSFGASNFISLTTDLRLFARFSDIDPLTGCTILAVFLYNRTITQQEHTSIYSNPWQLFSSETHKIYFSSSTPAITVPDTDYIESTVPDAVVSAPYLVLKSKRTRQPQGAVLVDPRFRASGVYLPPLMGVNRVLPRRGNLTVASWATTPVRSRGYEFVHPSSNDFTYAASGTTTASNYESWLLVLGANAASSTTLLGSGGGGQRLSISSSTPVIYQDYSDTTWGAGTIGPHDVVFAAFKSYYPTIQTKHGRVTGSGGFTPSRIPQLLYSQGLSLSLAVKWDDFTPDEQTVTELIANPWQLFAPETHKTYFPAPKVTDSSTFEVKFDSLSAPAAPTVSAAYLKLSSKRTRQPQTIARLNPAFVGPNDFVFNAATPRINLASGKPISISYAVDNPFPVTRYGISYQPIDDQFDGIQIVQSDAFYGGPGFTFATAVQGALFGNHLLAEVGVGGVCGYGISFASVDYAPDGRGIPKIGVTFYGVASYASSYVSTPADGLRFVVTGRTGRIAIFVNGALLETISAGTYIPNNGYSARCGAAHESGNAFRGAASHYFALDKELPDIVAAELSINPWQLFSPETHKSYFSIPSAPILPTVSLNLEAVESKTVFDLELVEGTSPAKVIDSWSETVEVEAAAPAISAPYLVLKSRRMRQPQGAQRLAPEWSRGSSLLFSFGGGNRLALGTNSNGLVLPSTRELIASSDGIAYKGNASEGAGGDSLTISNAFPSSNNAAFISIYVETIYAAWMSPLYSRSNGGGSTVSADTYRYTWAGGEYTYDSGLVVPAGKLVACGHIISPNKIFSVVNGKVHSAAASHAALSWGSGSEVKIGADSFGNRAFVGNIYATGLFVDAGITEEQLLEWSHNPWSIFAPDSRRIYFGVDTAVPSSGIITRSHEIATADQITDYTDLRLKGKVHG